MRCLFLLLAFAFGCQKIPSEKVRIGVDPSWYPLDFGAQTAYVNGFVEDLLLEIAKAEGIEFEKIPVNSESLFEGLHSQKYGAVLTRLPRYPYHLARYDFSKNFLEAGPVLILPKESPYRGLDQIQGFLIGVVMGDGASSILERQPEILIRKYPTAAELLDAVAQGEIQGALLGSLPAASYVSDLYAGRLKIISTPLEDVGLCLVAPKGKSHKLVEAFDRQLKKKKKLKALLQKWNLIAS